MAKFFDDFNPQIDRYDQASAARLFRRLWPDDAIALVCAQTLAESIQSAHRAGEECWSVTMFRNLVRLNVGQVETLTLTAGRVRFLFEGSMEHEVAGGIEIYQPTEPVFSAVPVTSGICIVQPKDLANLPASVRTGHHKYIRSAASYKRISPFRKAFSPSILQELRAKTGESVPFPAYFTQENSLDVETLADEVKHGNELFEGARYQIFVNAYERDPEARRRCIEKQGTACVICGFSFGERYGAVADGFTHVHHLRPIADIGQRYRIDPDTDLRPVCANCHAVLHRRTPPFSIEEVRALIQNHIGRSSR